MTSLEPSAARLATLSAAIAVYLLAPSAAFAHGSMENPISRVYACYKESPERPSSPACIEAAAFNKVALYDWMSVRIGDANGNHRGRIADGKLCSAGDPTFSALDAPRDDWPSTTLTPGGDGRLEMVFHATAPHATDYIHAYVTQPGYDPNQPLTWNTLEPQPFCELSSGEIVQDGNRYRLDCPFPTGLSGRQLIYTIWQRSDSPEAFYACSDVVLAGDPGPGPGPGPDPDPDPDPDKPTWFDLGAVIAEADLADGSTVTLRLFGADGSDAESHSVTVDASTGGQHQWPLLLADEVNANSNLVAIGELSGGEVIAIADASANHVFVTSDAGYSFLVDVNLPQPEPEPEPGDTWSADAVYLGGDRAVYQGVEYQAKWWTQGDLPGSTAVWATVEAPTDDADDWSADTVYLQGDQTSYQGVLYQAQWWTRGDVPGASAVWQRLTPTDGTEQWNAGAVYSGGDQVEHSGYRYEARWWTQGDEPGTHQVWTLIQ